MKLSLSQIGYAMYVDCYIAKSIIHRPPSLYQRSKVYLRPYPNQVCQAEGKFPASTAISRCISDDALLKLSPDKRESDMYCLQQKNANISGVPRLRVLHYVRHPKSSQTLTQYVCVFFVLL